MSDSITTAETPRQDEVLAQELVERARAEGVEVVGPGGLLTGLTKTVPETALEAEMDEHLGYAKHAVECRDLGNSRNGTRSKAVLTEIGEVEIEVPTCRAARSRAGRHRRSGNHHRHSDLRVSGHDEPVSIGILWS